MNILDLKFYCSDLKKDITIRDYLKVLLVTLWLREDEFSGKRPLGSGGWKFDMMKAAIGAKLIEGELDEEGYVKTCDTNAFNKMVADAIDTLK